MARQHLSISDPIPVPPPVRSVAALPASCYQMMRTKYGPPITVDAVSVSRVDPTTIEPTAFVQMYDGIYERPAEGRGAGKGGAGGGGQLGGSHLVDTLSGIHVLHT